MKLAIAFKLAIRQNKSSATQQRHIDALLPCERIALRRHSVHRTGQQRHTGKPLLIDRLKCDAKIDCTGGDLLLAGKIGRLCQLQLTRAQSAPELLKLNRLIASGTPIVIPSRMLCRSSRRRSI